MELTRNARKLVPEGDQLSSELVSEDVLLGGLECGKDECPSEEVAGIAETEDEE